MIADSRALRSRLIAACGCFIALSLLYIPAFAAASVAGTYSSFVHPWRSIPLDLLILGLSAASVVILSVFVRRGSCLHRLGAIALGTLPVWILGHFTLWLLRMYEN